MKFCWNNTDYGNISHLCRPLLEHEVHTAAPNEAAL